MPSLSQRYRPHCFADITGQSSITETLRREVASGCLGHAYLFSGPRGIGKTTTARVFAQALNCQALKDGEPCHACPSCLAADEGRLLDIIELDAATHTGVDTVREAIIEHVRFAPAFGRRKVYILDEAHMLSSSSWNALLKTLEEPPAYAFFILATTEWHKIPATILSRCQRFEFKRVADDVLAERVRDLATREGWRLTDEAVKLVVSRAEGCVRDAETLLGQLGALGETVIDVEIASLVIPQSHLPLAAGLMRAWAARDQSTSLSEARRLFDEGMPVLPLFDDLLTIVRRLLIAADQPALVSTWQNGTEEERSIAALVGSFSSAELYDMALLLFERRKDIKAGMDPLFALELVGTAVACKLLRHVSSSYVAPVLPSEPASTKPPTPLSGGLSDSDSVAATSVELDTVRAKWSAIIRAVDEQNHSLPFILKISRPEAVRSETLILRFQYAFHRDKVVTDIKNRRIVEACIREVVKCGALTIDGIVGEDQARQAERATDMVGNILKAFGGSVVEG